MEVCACNRRLLECWQQPALQRQETCSEACQPGAYIISGGLGSLGLLLTKWLTQSHPRQTHAVVLLGRTGRGTAAEEAASTAVEAATWLCAVRCDAGVQEEAAAACACSQVRHSTWHASWQQAIPCSRTVPACHNCLHVNTSYHDGIYQGTCNHKGLFTQGLHQPWSGFMHAGGVLADALVPNQNAGALRTVFGPKVRLPWRVQTGSTYALGRDKDVHEV